LIPILLVPKIFEDDSHSLVEYRLLWIRYHLTIQPNMMVIALAVIFPALKEDCRPYTALRRDAFITVLFVDIDCWITFIRMNEVIYQRNSVWSTQNSLRVARQNIY